MGAMGIKNLLVPAFGKPKQPLEPSVRHINVGWHTRNKLQLHALAAKFSSPHRCSTQTAHEQPVPSDTGQSHTFCHYMQQSAA